MRLRVTPPTRAPLREWLEAGCVTDQTRALDEMRRRQIVGQDEVLDSLTYAFSRVLSGLRDPDRPALTLLLLGPTGVGKTATARALARAVFGSRHALTQINCEEYAHRHELSKLLGTTPGYNCRPRSDSYRGELRYPLGAAGPRRGIGMDRRERDVHRSTDLLKAQVEAIQQIAWDVEVVGNQNHAEEDQHHAAHQPDTGGHPLQRA